MTVKNLQRRVSMTGRPLRRFLEHVAEDVAPAGSTATIVLVTDDRIRELNRTYRGYDRATDVLSFPSVRGDFPEDRGYLGDIVISVETARRQAVRRGSSLHRELRLLAVHALLHLLGYDHETDHGEMRRIEYRLRRKHGLTSPRGRR